MKQQKNSKTTKKISFILHMSLIVGMLFIAYIVEMNGISLQGYTIASLNKKVVLLKQQETKLNLYVAKNSSISSLMGTVARNNMEPSSFIYLKNNQVVVKR